MFNSCEKCEVRKLLAEQVSFLRTQVEELTKKLVVLADVKAYAYLDNSKDDPQRYYGSSDDDEFIEHDDFGNEVLVKRKITEQ